MDHQVMGHQVMGQEVSCNGVNVWIVDGDSGGLSRTSLIESVCVLQLWGRFFHLDVDGWLTPPRLICGLCWAICLWRGCLVLNPSVPPGQQRQHCFACVLVSCPLGGPGFGLSWNVIFPEDSPEFL